MKKIIIVGIISVGVGLGIWFITSSQKPATTQTSLTVIPQEITFNGEKGTDIALVDKLIKLDSTIFNDNQAKFYNVKMPDAKTIYFFVVKDKNGIYRAAANACEICYKTYKGFRQEGEEIICNNCETRYPLEKIGTEKGGCNPGPISPNLTVENNQVLINQVDLEQVSTLF
ncbi:MAG: hypothetical protein UT02_C0012G0013 [Parcubacteria group bacterium GW2011_GWC2_38_7]|nr:MAG: hypothetical protein UT02_C0012G0013 [Parcubacteria group bacterium GW2011_GWC2_38_7]